VVGDARFLRVRWIMDGRMERPGAAASADAACRPGHDAVQLAGRTGTGTGTTRQDACMDVAAASGDGGVGTDRDRMEGAA
jgi:hypothetical protein